MKKWFLYPVAALLALLAIAYLVGLTRDPELRTEVSMEIARPPEVIFPLIADPTQIQKYYPEIGKIEILQQNPLRFRLTSKEATATMEITNAEAPSHVVSKTLDEPFGVSGVWDTTITPTPTGSRIQHITTLQFRNPLMRTMALFIDAKAEELQLLEKIKRYAEAH